jgi:protein-tyrosine phosphatase
MTRVLFVCLGNICRSPTAEAVFRKHAALATLEVEIRSAGTGGHHAGDPADPRTARHARERGYDLSTHRARQVQAGDFSRYDHVFAMDRSNLAVLERACPAEHRHKLGLFLDLAPELGVREVPDPYYGGPHGFEQVLDLVEAASEALVRRVRAKAA